MPKEKQFQQPEEELNEVSQKNPCIFCVLKNKKDAYVIEDMFPALFALEKVSHTEEISFN